MDQNTDLPTKPNSPKSGNKIPSSSFISSINQSGSPVSKPVRQPKAAKRSRRLRLSSRIVAAILVIVVIAGIFGLFALWHRQKHPLFPTDVTSGLPYVVYYPTKAGGFNYKINSIKVNSSILFYIMTKGQKQIYITEQAAPLGVNLHSLPNHSDINIGIGKAVIGTGLNNPSIVILTPTTLVNLTSNKNVSKNDITKLAQGLAVLKNPNAYSY